METEPQVAQARDYGALILALTLESPEWILRRVETFRIEDDLTVNVRVSMDYDLSRVLSGVLYQDLVKKGLLPQLLLPLGFLAKEPLHDFSLIDQGGSPLSLLTEEETSPISVAVAHSLARAVLDQENIAQSILDFIEKVVTSDAATSERLVKEGVLASGTQIDQIDLRSLLAHSTFWYLITNLARSFIAMAVAARPKGSSRKILKYAYVTTLPWGWAAVGLRTEDLAHNALTRLALRPADVYLQIPLVASSGSYHADVEAPTNLELRKAEIRRSGGGENVILQRHAGKFTRAHLHLRDSTVGAASAHSLHLQVSPQRRGFVRDASIATVFSTIALLVVLLFIGRVNHSDSASPIPIITIIPGLLAAYLSRPTEHPLASRLYFGLRCILAFSAALAWLAAVATLLDLSDQRLLITIICLLGFSLMCSVLAVTAYVRASGPAESVRVI